MHVACDKINNLKDKTKVLSICHNVSCIFSVVPYIYINLHHSNCRTPHLHLFDSTESVMLNDAEQQELLTPLPGSIKAPVHYLYIYLVML